MAEVTVMYKGINFKVPFPLLGGASRGRKLSLKEKDSYPDTELLAQESF